jgi:hypothetical protein
MIAPASETVPLVTFADNQLPPLLVVSAAVHGN